MADDFMLPELTLPADSLYIIYQLKKAGHDAFLIGGSVRDLLAHAYDYYQTPVPVITDDFDYTTSATPEQIMAVFPDSFYENNFGTVSVTVENLRTMMGLQPVVQKAEIEDVVAKIPVYSATRPHESLTLPERPKKVVEQKDFQITTFRVGEKYDTDNRRPSELQWGKKLQDDLARRDFTVGAIALTFPLSYLEKIFNRPLQEKYNIAAENYELVDEFGGMQDLKENLVRAIGEPDKRFGEDALRLLRAVRLSVQLNFAIEEKTYEALKRNAALLGTISAERVRDELGKILASDYPREGIELLDETGLLEFIIPELLAAKNVAQSGHHTTDVWAHSLDALAESPSRDPIVRLAILLHDIAKPETQKWLDGQWTFYNHQVVGAHLAKRIAQRLRFSSEQIERIFILVRHHMFHYEPKNTDASIRRFMRQVGLNNLNDILDLREADRLGSNARKTSWRLEEMKQRMIEQLNQPMQIRDLAIDGNDLMQEFDLLPSPVLGRVLNALLESVLEDASLNDRKKLLALAAQILKNESQ